MHRPDSLFQSESRCVFDLPLPLAISGAGISRPSAVGLITNIHAEAPITIGT
jgi:hypothetical protein